MNPLDRIIPSRRRAHARAQERARIEARQIPLTDDDTTEITTVCASALQDKWSDGKVTETNRTRGGMIVRGHASFCYEPSAMRSAVEALGYVVAPNDYGNTGILVTGVDPAHFHGHLTRERIDNAIEALVQLRAETFNRPSPLPGA